MQLAGGRMGTLPKDFLPSPKSQETDCLTRLIGDRHRKYCRVHIHPLPLSQLVKVTFTAHRARQFEDSDEVESSSRHSGFSECMVKPACVRIILSSWPRLSIQGATRAYTMHRSRSGDFDATTSI